MIQRNTERSLNDIPNVVIKLFEHLYEHVKQNWFDLFHLTLKMSL